MKLQYNKYLLCANAIADASQLGVNALIEKHLSGIWKSQAYGKMWFLKKNMTGFKIQWSLGYLPCKSQSEEGLSPWQQLVHTNQPCGLQLLAEVTVQLQSTVFNTASPVNQLGKN